MTTGAVPPRGHDAARPSAGRRAQGVDAAVRAESARLEGPCLSQSGRIGAPSAAPVSRAREGSRGGVRGGRLLHAAALLAGVALIALATAPASAAGGKGMTMPETTGSVPTPGSAAEGAPMLLEADQVVYDRDRDTVTAIGNVHIYYKGNTLTANRVTYVRKDKRALADGDARLTEPGGNVVSATHLDITEGFGEGFAQSLRVDSVERARFAAESARRTEGNVTVFEKGVYSACQTCVDEPEKPPFWQIKAARIIHNQQEKTVYYEDARLELMGVPIAYVPYFMHPDPSVKRKTGFLSPGFVASSKLGFGYQQPFFWAPTQDWDVTLSPALLSRQGFFGDAEVRHAFEAGRVSLRAMGIQQQNPSAFAGTSGERRARGAVVTKGEFDINEHWKWGWDATLITDRRFLTDYKIVPSTQTEVVSTFYLQGQGEKNWFDARTYKFSVLTDDNRFDRVGRILPNGVGTKLQQKQAVVHPVIDYNAVFGDPVLGGELSGDYNMVSLSRNATDKDVAGRIWGLSGYYTRLTGQLGWRREIIDDYGQIFQPFARVRGDVFFDKNTDKNVAGFVSDGAAGRFTPTAGLEYRYPWLATSSAGAHVIEPIVQVVARPNETYVGRLPNEDAQSLVFDTTTLFQADKFSGYDRAEGGTRANVGLGYTFTPLTGGSVSTMFGRSYLIAGQNSFAAPNLTTLLNQNAAGGSVPLTGYGSGLESRQSDYVGRVSVDTNRGVIVGAQGRFDTDTFRVNRAEVSATGVSGPVTASVTYSYLKTPKYVYDLIDRQYTVGSNDWTIARQWVKPERQEVQTAMNLRLADNWRLFGAVRYDLRGNFVAGDSVGLGYDNDSFSASLALQESSNLALDKSGNVLVGARTVFDRTLYFRFGLRTLGDGQVSNSLLR